MKMKSTYEKPSERKKRVQTENLKKVKKTSKIKKQVLNLFKMRGFKMPSGKVKWFNAKKVMGLLLTMRHRKIFFFTFQS